MAAYAAALMSGPALRWHMGLPRDVRGDWRKMEVALLDRFAPDQPPAAPSNNPTVPSGAPVAPTLCFGRIRVTETNTGRFVGYMANNIAKKNQYYAHVPKQLDDALVVQFTPSSSPVTFDLVDQSSYHRLALRGVGELELTTSSYRHAASIFRL
ncbi:hypothetical protein FRC04_003528 [Tulasnella sp. 424]|nr:hypothetical protein FRC04_003528 [Tulasnella sp. 424]